MEWIKSDLDVPPQPSASDVLYVGAFQSEVSRNRGDGFSASDTGQDVDHQRLCEFRVPGILASDVAMSDDAISGILAVSSEVQVVRTNTATIVAVVQYEKAVFNGASLQLPGDSVRSFRASAHCEPAITSMQRALPVPALAPPVDLRPEAVDIGGAILVVHREPPTRVATPRAVDAAPGYFAYCNVTMSGD